MNEEKTNIVPYNNVTSGSAQPPKDYSNSNRSKMAALGKPPSAPPAAARQPQGEIANDGGFFKATLKQAIDHAIATVIDPMVRNFVYSTGMSILNTLLWNGGKGSPGVPFVDNKVPYNQISTSLIGGQTQTQRQQPQMTPQDKVWQNYQKLHTETLDKANYIMSRLYRAYRVKGQVTLAYYYEAFGERYAFEDENWGWTSLPKDQMYAQQYPDGYHVIMPKLERLQ